METQSETHPSPCADNEVLNMESGMIEHWNLRWSEDMVRSKIEMVADGSNESTHTNAYDLNLKLKQL